MASVQKLWVMHREKIEVGTLGFADMIEREGLVAAFDRLVHFGHWITPAHMPKRFDTYFSLQKRR